MYPFYIPPELYEALGPVVVPLPHPKKDKRTAPTPFPEGRRGGAASSSYRSAPSSGSHHPASSGYGSTSDS
jgi:hypothetical protein